MATVKSETETSEVRLIAGINAKLLAADRLREAAKWQAELRGKAAEREHKRGRTGVFRRDQPAQVGVAYPPPASVRATRRVIRIEDHGPIRVPPLNSDTDTIMICKDDEGALREKVSRFRGELLPDILPLCVTEAKAEVNNKVVQSMGSTLVKRLPSKARDLLYLLRMYAESADVLHVRARNDSICPRQN
ncbi:hypothetical protein PR003_g8865 [Phytophthora rubi]|uniref:Uncharacterized protein n=1 Tax=Phytophthora rubi TaxID=129364 RepID=A0A6A4FFW6_9STRA|nr:hypothetical protein PR003_g8865 [Phytophthora rubi]